MEIKKTGINYRYEDDGVTVSHIDISYSGYESNGDSINSTATVTADMLEDVTFDDLTAKDLDKLGRSKIAAWFGAEKPTETTVAE